jgi:nitrogen PTS system EIIA component
MTIDELLSPADMALDVRAPDKESALRNLSTRLGAKVSIDPDTILAAMMKREELGSTGMGDGAAIPHARISGVLRPAAVFARLKHKVPFEAVDGQPVDLVCMLVLPSDPQCTQLSALATVARAFRNADLRMRLRAARDGEGAFRAFLEADHA